VKNRSARKYFSTWLPNQPKNDQFRKNFREMLRQKFDERLPDAAELFGVACAYAFSAYFSGLLFLMVFGTKEVGYRPERVERYPV